MKTDIADLPVLGVGASLSLSSKPDPVSLVKAQGGPSFVEYAGLVDVEAVIDEVNRVHEAGAPVLYHPSYINFCGSYPNSRDWLEETAKHIETVNSAWFAQDVAYCFWETGSAYSTSLGYFIPPVFNQISLERAVERVNEVQSIVSVTVAVEPPPLTFFTGSMSLFEFFGELSEQTDCAILLDMGHLVSYEMASGKKIIEQLDQLPCERVIEVHIAGGRLKQANDGPIYVDAHECSILDQTWAMFETMLPKLPDVKAVCYECEGVQESSVLPTLKKIRRLVKERSASKGLVNKLDGVK
ncbi:MAG: DUF692 family protein [Proteobacteria bacterium]|nr:DUF692 family protein [Pseudomonadota bacterium]